MSIERFYVHDVTILEPTWDTDRYGGRIANWANPTRTPASGWLTPDANLGGSTESGVDGREAIASDWELTLPPGTPIARTSRVERDDTTFTVVGDVKPAATPAGTHHLVVRLRTVVG